MRSPEIIENMPFNGRATVKEGSSVQLSCAAIGNPQPTIKWKRGDGKRMKFRGRNGNVQHSKLLSVLSPLGCPRKSETSQTEKFLWDTRFSHYLGQKHYRNAKKI